MHSSRAPLNIQHPDNTHDCKSGKPYCSAPREINNCAPSTMRIPQTFRLLGKLVCCRRLNCEKTGPFALAPAAPFVVGKAVAEDELKPPAQQTLRGGCTFYYLHPGPEQSSEKWAKHGNASVQTKPHARDARRTCQQARNAAHLRRLELRTLASHSHECPFLHGTTRGTRVAHLMEIGRAEQRAECGRRQRTTAPTRHARVRWRARWRAPHEAPRQVRT